MAAPPLSFYDLRRRRLLRVIELELDPLLLLRCDGCAVAHGGRELGPADGIDSGAVEDMSRLGIHHLDIADAAIRH